VAGHNTDLAPQFRQGLI